VFFVTAKRLTPDDRDSGRRDVYMRRNGRTTLVSKASGVPQPDTGDASFEPGLANIDGFYFASSERLGPGDTDAGAIDAYFSNVLPRLSLGRFKPSVFRANEGTTISFVVTEPARVTIAFRREGRTAVVGRRNFQTYGGITRREWHGRLADGRRLGPGRYTATFVARDGNGGRSTSDTSTIDVLQPNHSK
jgi:hypothetical protein